MIRNGTRLFIDSTINYKTIKGVSYENDILIVKNSNNELIKLKEPRWGNRRIYDNPEL